MLHISDTRHALTIDSAAEAVSAAKQKPTVVTQPRDDTTTISVEDTPSQAVVGPRPDRSDLRTADAETNTRLDSSALPNDLTAPQAQVEAVAEQPAVDVEATQDPERSMADEPTSSAEAPTQQRLVSRLASERVTEQQGQTERSAETSEKPAAEKTVEKSAPTTGASSNANTQDGDTTVPPEPDVEVREQAAAVSDDELAVDTSNSNFGKKTEYKTYNRGSKFVTHYGNKMLPYRHEQAAGGGGPGRSKPGHAQGHWLGRHH